jgi:chemotaxis protein methyltransferase CheR
MLLHHEFPELRGWDVQHLATDLSSAVLTRAREGRYTQLEVNRGLPAKYLVSYFTKAGNDWQLKEDIRAMVRFEELNLIKPWPSMGPFDIVMIRNVMIYFDTDAKREILRRVRGLLRPDGYLFLGGAETTMNLDDTFDRQQFERAGCYRLKCGQAA